MTSNQVSQHFNPRSNSYLKATNYEVYQDYTEHLPSRRFLTACREQLVRENDAEPGAFGRFQARSRDIGDWAAYAELYNRRQAYERTQKPISSRK